MRSLTLDFQQRRLRERETPEPTGGVLLRVREVGVCGTDRELAAFEFGRPPEGCDYLILGHEALCEIVATGELVVPLIRRGCEPPCAQCARGRPDLCLTGNYTERGIVGAHGYFAELAAARREDLVSIPAPLADVAVLAEPLSVVEKAVETALRLHIGEPRRALVMGAGTIGLLAAMLLRLRGFEVEVCSIEPPGSARARLVESAGAGYVQRPSRPADVVIEAAGSGEAARTGACALARLGVMVVLGAPAGEISLIELIVGNRVIAGSINASSEAFRAGVADLARMPRAVLAAMIERMRFSDWPRSISGASVDAPKVVHVLD